MRSAAGRNIVMNSGSSVSSSSQTKQSPVVPSAGETTADAARRHVIQNAVDEAGDDK